MRSRGHSDAPVLFFIYLVMSKASLVELELGGEYDPERLVKGGADGQPELVGAPVEGGDRLGRERVVLQELEATYLALLDPLRVRYATLLWIIAAEGQAEISAGGRSRVMGFTMGHEQAFQRLICLANRVSAIASTDPFEGFHPDPQDNFHSLN